MEKIFDIAKDSEKSWGTLATAIDGNFEEVFSKIGYTRSNTDAIPANGEYVNRDFTLADGEDVGLYVDADAIFQPGCMLTFYIYKNDGMRISRTIKNKTTYDSLRTLFSYTSGDITGYAYYITGHNAGNVITSFKYYGVEDDVETLSTSIPEINESILCVSDNLAYTQKIAGGRTTINIALTAGLSVEPDVKFPCIIKKDSQVTFNVVDADGIINSNPSVYLWYTDETRSPALNVNTLIDITSDVEAIAIYLTGSSVLMSGTIKLYADFSNLIIKEAKDYADGKDKLFELVGIGASSAIYSDWKIGDLYYSTSRNKIYRCCSIAPFDTEETNILDRGVLYKYNGIIYIYDGISLTKYHDKDIEDGVILDYNEYLVGEDVNNDNTGGDKATYIYKDIARFGVAADEQVEISCDNIKDAISARSIQIYGFTKNGEKTEIKSMGAGKIVFLPSLLYEALSVRLYPTTSGMSALYATYTGLKIRKTRSEPVPAYYLKDNYLKDKLSTIRGKMADAQGNYDAFVFITDIHWLRNTKNSPALINYISSRVPLPRVIMGGDYADGLNIDCNLAFNSLSNKIYRAIGNHEYMNYFEEDGVQVKTNITDAEIWSSLQSGMTDCVIGDANTNYYYVDNTVQKMRYVFLSVFTDDSAGKFEETQATWLNNTLANMPDGYLAVVVAHYYMSDDYPTSWTPTLTSIGQQIANICDSHSGNVACMLQGHTHMDLMKKTDGGIPIFSTTCDKANADSDEIGERASYIYGKRTNGTINEQAFDVVIINKNAKKVSLVRIGAPADNGGGAELEVREQTYA